MDALPPRPARSRQRGHRRVAQGALSSPGGNRPPRRCAVRALRRDTRVRLARAGWPASESRSGRARRRRTRGLDLLRRAEWQLERDGARWRGRGLLVVVLQIAAEACTAFDVEDDAGIDRTRVNVHADGTLVPLGEVLDPVNRLRFVDRVQRTAGYTKLRAKGLHLDA